MNRHAICTRVTIECEVCGRSKCIRCGRCKRKVPSRHGSYTVSECPSARCRLVKAVKRLFS